MAVTITAQKFFTGTGPIKFSEIRTTFGDVPPAGGAVRMSDYKRNSAACVDWNGDSTITPRVPDATENAQLPDINQNIQLQDYRNTIREYDVTQTGSEEERVYTDGNESDWNNNLSKNVIKDYNVTGTIYSNEVDKFALTFEEGIYNNLEINVSGNIYGEGGAVGGQNGGGALYINNTFDCDKVTLDVTNNGKIWAGGGGGTAGTAGNAGPDLACREAKNWVARNKYGAFSLCNPERSSNSVLRSSVYDEVGAAPNVTVGDGACVYPELTCLAGSGDPGGEQFPVSHALNTNIPARIIATGTNWNQADDYGGTARTLCRGANHGNTGLRGGVLITPIKRQYTTPGILDGQPITIINATWENQYQCNSDWEMSCSGNQANTIAGGNPGNGGNGGAGKGFTNLNTSIHSAPHVGNNGNPGNTTYCNWASMRGTSVGNDGNPGNRGGDWGQAASSGGSGGAAITKKQIIMNNLQRNGSVDDNVKGNIANI